MSGNFTINITGIGDFVSFTSQQTLGFLPVIILLGLFGVGFVHANKRFSVPVSIFLVLSLLLPIVSLFVVLKLMDASSILLYILLMGISGVFAFMKRGG